MVFENIKNRAGIGLRYPHYQQILLEHPDIAWLEVHSENFFHLNSIASDTLKQISQNYPISMHGVGLSLGSADGLSKSHLKQLKASVDYFKPVLVSEHLSWNRYNGKVVNDLLPLPYTQASLLKFCDNVKTVQDVLGQQILIENPSTYLSYAENDMPEWDFYAQLPALTGCALLFDVNNVLVNAHNHRFDEMMYLKAIDGDDVKEVHLAGATVNTYKDNNILIDDHGCEVGQKTWDFYEKTLAVIGVKPSLIERDNNIPALEDLIKEKDKAQTYLEIFA